MIKKNIIDAVKKMQTKKPVVMKFPKKKKQVLNVG